MLVLVNQCSADETKRRASSERASEQKTVYYLGAWNRLNVIKTLSCLHSCSSSRFNMDGDQIPRSNFDSFWRAVITVFQVRKWYRWIFVWSFFPSSWRVLPESSERQEIAGLKYFSNSLVLSQSTFWDSRMHLCALDPTTFLEIALCQICMFYIYDADTWVCPIGVHIKEGRL